MIENYVLHTSVYTCDRCGGEARGQGKSQPDANAIALNRVATLELSQYWLNDPKDPSKGSDRFNPIDDEKRHSICGDCVKSLLEWWTSVDVPA